MRTLLALLLLAAALPAFAQEDMSSDDSSGSDDAPSMMRPASDSPESAAHPHKYDGPKHRAQAFLIPMDEGARTPTSRVAQAVEDVLLHTAVYDVVDLGHALAVESTAEQSQHADAGRKLVQEGNAAAGNKGWPEAAAKYQRALQEFDKGLPAVGAREYADAVLRLGAADWMSGEEGAAKEQFALLARLDPMQKQDVHAVEPAVEGLVATARSEADAQKRGSLDLDARPAGAKVKVDGESKGSAPGHFELTAGRHLVRVERSGFYPWSEFVEIAPRKTSTQSLTLAATPTATTLNQIIAGASDEVGRGKADKSVSALAQKFSLERVMIGSVRTQDETKVSVVLALVDAPDHKVIASKTLTLVADGTDADQIELETQTAARKLIAQDGTEEAKQQQTSADEPAPSRKPMMPGAMPEQKTVEAKVTPSDEAGLVSRERKVAIPAASKDPEPAAPKDSAKAAARDPEPVAPASKAEVKKKESRKEKGLRGKTGTESWGDDD